MATTRGNKPIEALYNHWEDLTPDLYTELLVDFESYCSKGCIIINKNGSAVPFKLNEAQKKIAELLLPLIFKEIPEPVTVVIHKARQEGVSVLFAALEKYISTKRRNLSTVHLLPTDDLASKFYEQKMLPLLEGTHPQLLPKTTVITKPVPYIRVRELHGTALNSFIKIGGSRSKASGRSGTNQIVIFDEYAYYEQVQQLEKGVLATQPKTGLALTVYVSTANGVNHFYDVVKLARQDNTHMKYLFLPWHMLKEYEMEPKGRLADLTSLHEYELKLLRIFEDCGYPIETWARKLQFYEYTLENEAKNDWDFMFSEYPSTPEESFEASGKPVLPASVLMNWRDDMPEFKHIEAFSSGHSVEFDIVERSSIKMYEEPIQGKRYMIGVDPSNGEEAGDSSAGVVLDVQNMQEVCTFVEKIDQTELADLVVNLAKYYNGAIIVPERNMGRTLIDWIRLQLNYHRLYVDPVSTTRNRTQYGVHMTRPMKNEAIERMRFFMNNAIWYSPDQGFIDDALHFSWKETPGGFQKAVAQGTDENNQPYHDDTVMARLTLTLALDMRRWKEYGERNAKKENGRPLRLHPRVYKRSNRLTSYSQERHR